MKVQVSVPGKIILSGEHAVVHGKPAIAAAVDRRLRVILQARQDGKQLIKSSHSDLSLVKKAIEKFADRQIFLSNGTHNKKYNGFELKIKSDIPIGSGMGSSAAVAVGAIAVFMVASGREAKLDLEKINKLAYEVEKIQHGTPSGIDNSTVTFGGFLWYRKEFEFLKTFWKLPFKIATDMQHFYLINTGKPDETTGGMVQKVREEFCKNHVPIGTKILQLLSNFEKVTKQVALGLQDEDEKLLVESIKENERLLEKLGVVGEFAKGVIREIESTGGVAKISGAGGVKDRSGFLLVYHKEKKAVEQIAKKHSLNYFPAKLGVEGAKLEKLAV